nr:TOBE domain-containing protein [uncultured Desulfuromonas sp.]
MEEILESVGLAGQLWFHKADKPFVGRDKICLLEKIDELGSINKAAKALGISYRTAWDAVNLINNLSDFPLVEKASGGKGGGGTHLTDLGKEIIRKYQLLQQEHQSFLVSLEEKLGDLSGLENFLDRVTVKVSARNVLYGTLANVSYGTVHAKATLTLKGGSLLHAIVTRSAAESLELHEGLSVYALIQAGSVVVADDLDGLRISAGNLFEGTVRRLLNGPVNTEVDLEIPGGDTISAVITAESAQHMKLQPGSRACAFFKASHVILGVAC